MTTPPSNFNLYLSGSCVLPWIQLPHDVDLITTDLSPNVCKYLREKYRNYSPKPSFLQARSAWWDMSSVYRPEVYIHPFIKSIIINTDWSFDPFPDILGKDRIKWLRSIRYWLKRNQGKPRQLYHLWDSYCILKNNDFTLNQSQAKVANYLHNYRTATFNDVMKCAEQVIGKYIDNEIEALS